MSEVLLINPRKRRATRRRTTTTRRRRRRNPVAANPRRRRRRTVGRRRSYRRRNPAGGFTARGIQNQVMGAFPGAFGALALDVALGYIPLPITTPLMGYVVKGIGAIGIGWAANASRLVKGTTANQMTQGALTVMIHGALKQSMAQFAPQILMGEYLTNGGMDGLGYAGSGWNPSSDVAIDNGMGTYLPSLSSETMRTDDEYGLGKYEGALPGGAEGELY